MLAFHFSTMLLVNHILVGSALLSSFLSVLCCLITILCTYSCLLFLLYCYFIVLLAFTVPKHLEPCVILIRCHINNKYYYYYHYYYYFSILIQLEISTDGQEDVRWHTYKRKRKPIKVLVKNIQ